MFGGRNLETSDNTSTLAGSEHVTRVAITNASVSNINSGFSFTAVTRTGDGDDDGAANRTVQGSLRQFIQNANALSGVQTSGFRLQTFDSNYNDNQLGVFTITPTSALPTITDATIIDATTQSQYITSPVIEIDGSNAGANANGFNITGGNSTIKGFAINGFASGSGIIATNAGSNNIDGNYIGIRATGDDAIEGATAWFQGENNANDAAAGRNGTLNNGVSFGTGKIGTAFDLDGVNDYVSLSTASTLGMNGNFTAMAWINGDTFNVAGDNTIFGQDAAGLHLVVRNQKAYMGFYGNDIAGVQTLSAGQWYHVAFRYTNGEQAIYVNGVLDSSGTGHAALASNAAVNIGRWSSGAYFDGRIDDASIIGRSLSATEIAAEYSAGLSGKSAAKIPIVSNLQAEGDATDSRGIATWNALGGVTYTTGIMGNAFSFDGLDDRIEAADPSLFDTTQSSYSVWFKLNDTAGFPNLIGRQYSNDYGWTLHINPTGSLRVRIDTDTASNQSVSTSSGLDDGRWHLATFTLDRVANQASLSVDGANLTTGTFTGTFGTATGGTMAAAKSIVGAQYLNGQLDELSAYNRLLTNSEIANLYQSQSRDNDTFAATPVASYKAEGDANDFTSANEGTVVGGVSYVPGKSGQAFDLNGTTGYISIPDASAIEVTSQLTLSAWINPDDVGNFRQIISKFGSSGNYAYQIGLAPSGRLRIDFSGDGAGYTNLESSTGALTTGTWQLVTATFDNGAAKLYINGNQVASSTMGFTSIYSAGNSNLNIGRDPAGSQYFDGRIDEAAVYNRALSAGEISTLYNSANQSTIGNSTGITLSSSAGNEICRRTECDQREHDQQYPHQW